MKSYGNPTMSRLIVLLIALVASVAARAELTASVDRDRVAMGDTVTLTISATANEAINNIDLRPLLTDFEILQRSSSSTTKIINGVSTSTRQMILALNPRREGTLRVPPLRTGRSESPYLLIAVGPATTAAGDPLVSFEAELDSDEIYVQGQAILTLRIQQAINLDKRSISEFQLENAFVRPLEQKSFQRTIAGRTWLVHEVRYAIFPEQSGKLEIPAQTFSARESQARRSLFDQGSSGRQVKRSSEALTLRVLPRPGIFPAATWLPARKLKIAETWSTEPEQLRVGESATRRITIEGEGLQGAQLPPMLFPATAGLKYYPDQPTISDNEIASGLVGTRADSVAIVPTRAGTWSIPEVRIPWWDTEADKIQYAVLPARTVTVVASLDAAAPLSVPDPTLAAPHFDTTPIAVAPARTAGGSTLWIIATAVSTLGWLLTLALFLSYKSRWVQDKSAHGGDGAVPAAGEAGAFKQLLAACASGNAPQARTYLVQWTAALFSDKKIHSLDQVLAQFNDTELADELDRMNAAMYGSQQAKWDGSGLLTLIKTLRQEYSSKGRSKNERLELYPT